MIRAIAAALLGIVAFAGCAPKETPPDPVRPAQLVKVRVGNAATSAVFAGDIRPRYETDLAFRIAGKLVERKVDVGARVRRGQVLARLDPADVSLQAESARAALAAAETDFAFAKAELARYQNLYAQKFISESALDAKRSAHDTARAKVEQARAQLAVTRNQSGYAVLAAPDDGVITSITAEAGQVVGAGQAVMKLAREAEREVAISVPENRLGELRNAKALAVALAASPDKIYAGRVREVAPAVDPVTRTFAVRVAVVDADPMLQWGMTANVAVMGQGAGNAALVPLSSVYHHGDGAPAVWVYEPQTGKVALRAVTLGAYREDGVLIPEGLADGEWIVAAGVNKLRPGQVVKPYEVPGKPLPAPARTPSAP